MAPPALTAPVASSSTLTHLLTHKLLVNLIFTSYNPICQQILLLVSPNMSISDDFPPALLLPGWFPTTVISCLDDNRLVTVI